MPKPLFFPSLSMGSAISALAFPAPHLPAEHYEGELLSHPGYRSLTTARGEAIPAVLVKAGGGGGGRDGDGGAEHRGGGTAQAAGGWNGGGGAAAAAPVGLTILHAHGNAEDLSLGLADLSYMAWVTGCDVLGYEYVGYATSRLAGGAPSEEGCLRSADAAWRHATEELRIAPGRIVLSGRSIGTGPTVDLASRAGPCASGGGGGGGGAFAASPLDCAGVLLQSPIASGARALTGGRALAFFAAGVDIFRSYAKVGRIAAPVAIAHGTDDDVVPCENGRQLHALLRAPFAPLWMEGWGHNNMPAPEVMAFAKRFVDSLAAGR